MENELHAAGYGSVARDAIDVTASQGTGQQLVPSNDPTRGGTSIPIRKGQVHQSHGIASRPGTAVNTRGASTPAKRAKKDRGPNWSISEINALVNAKQEQFLEEQDVVDGRDLMHPDASKWIRISIEVMRAGISPCPRDGPACKSKWNQIIPEYKRIADFFIRSGTNGMEYWDMNAAERKSEGLPRSFSQDIFNNIHEWYRNRPSMQPPHTRDLLSNEDSNYIAPVRHDQEVPVHANSDDNNEDPMDLCDIVELSNGTNGTFSSPTTPANTGARTANAFLSNPSASPVGGHQNGLPPGITPVIVSSSDTSTFTLRHKEGNTAVRCKHLSGPNIIAKATKLSGEVMASQMREMAQATRDLEQTKVSLQLKIFAEQMDYQRERDRRLHENARQANLNARLAIDKQSEVVKCLSELSCVFSVGLRQSAPRPRPRQLGKEPQAAPPNPDIAEYFAKEIRSNKPFVAIDPTVAPPSSTEAKL